MPENISDCQPIDDSNRFLYWDGSNFSLVDNGLRCFKLNSILPDGCKSLRVWKLTHNMDLDSLKFKLRMFEVRMDGSDCIARLYEMDWFLNPNEKFEVKCIRNENFFPKSGWELFNKQMEKEKLNQIYTLSDSITPYYGTGGNLLMVQYVSDSASFNVDFSLRGDLPLSKNEKDVAFLKLVKLLRKEFDVYL